MRRYRLIDRFDSRTGKKLEHQAEEAGIICDYCGITEEENDELSQSIDYNIHEYEGSNLHLAKWN